MAILDPEKFLPTATTNILKSFGAWNRDATEWEELITELEANAISVITANINYEQVKDDDGLLKNLVSKHVQSELYLPLFQMDDLLEKGNVALIQFTELLDKIKVNQKENGITTDEANERRVAGVIAFN